MPPETQQIATLQLELARHRALSGIALEARRGAQLAALFQMAMRSLCEVMRLEFCKILRLSDDCKQLSMVASHGWRSEDTLVEPLDPRQPRSQSSYAALTRQLVVADDLLRESRFQPSPLATTHGVRSGLCTPIEANGKTWGVVGAYSAQARAYSDAETAFLESLAELLGQAVERTAPRVGSVAARTEGAAYGALDERVFTLSLDLISEASFDGRLIRVNPAWTSCLGWSTEELTSHPWLHFVHPDDHDKTVQAAAVLLQGQPLLDFENRYLCKDGTTRTLSWNCYPEPASRRIISVTRDISERKRAEQQLRLSEERYRLMIEGSEQIMFYSHDRDHVFTYLSPSTLQVLGYSPGELLGQLSDSLVIADDPINDDVHRLTDQALQDGKACEPYRVAVRHRLGHRLVLEILESPVITDGRIVGIQGFARDLTEHERAQRNLEVSEARFRNFFEQASVGMVIASPEGRFLRVNQRFAEMLGYEAEEIVGRACAVATHPDDRSREAESIARISAGEVEGASWEKRYLRRDGSPLWCRLTLSRLVGEDPDDRHFIGVAEDISVEKQAQESAAQNEALLRIAGKAARLGGWLLDLDSGSLRWSDEVRRIHEVADDYQPSLDGALDFYHPTDRDRVRAELNRCIESGLSFSTEYPLRTAAGRSIWVLSMGEAVQDDRGRTVAIQGACQDISERKLAEASLSESLRRFRAMADTLPFTVWTLGADGRFDFGNEHFWRFSEFDRQQPDDELLRSLVHEDDLDALFEAWDASLSGHVPLFQVVRMWAASEHGYRWHQLHQRAVRNEDGTVGRWIGLALDVHESREVEERATQLARRLHDTLESITDAFFVLSRDWTFSFMNSQAERLLNRPRDSVLGKNIWDEFPDAINTQFKPQYELAMREGRAVHFQEHYPAPLDCWFDVSAYPSDEGLAVYFRDVSEARKSLAQLRLLETAVSRLNDIVLITEAEPFDEPGPRIVFANEAFERRTGYRVDEVIGKSPRILQGPKTQALELARIRRALLAWEPVRAELINYTKAGEEFWLELDIVPLADETGWFTHWVAVERDVTERHRMSEQLQASQRLESIGQLTGGVAHDFNNLLTVIIGGAEVLKERMLNPAEQEIAGMLLDAAARGADLTHRLLAFARRQALDPKRVDLNSLVGGLRPLLRRTLGEQVQIEFDQRADLWQALVDPPQLESALLNLCLNSRDAMAGGGKLTIETDNVWLDQDYCDLHQEVSPGPYAMLAVSDTGSGIAPESLARVFEPFFTTKERGKGSGMGLAMVYGFVKQSGGHVSVYSEVDEGTTIKIYLPRCHEDVPEVNPASQEPAATAGQGRILLVEDDAHVREFAAAQVASLGYSVVTAENGAQALVWLNSQEAFDLLFTDVVMPGMSGRKLAEEAVRLRPGLRVLFTSGYTENAIVHHGRLDEGVQLLQKPYRKADLARKIIEALS